MRATFAFAGVEGHASATRPMLFLILGAHVSGAEFIYPDKSWKETSGMLADLVADSGAGKGRPNASRTHPEATSLTLIIEIA